MQGCGKGLGAVARAGPGDGLGRYTSGHGEIKACFREKKFALAAVVKVVPGKV